MPASPNRPGAAVLAADAAQILSLTGVTKTFGATRALDGFTATIEKGEFVTVVGPSGCGKSTLFNIVAGLEEPDPGCAMRFEGKSVIAADLLGRVSFMPQRDLLLPWRTVIDNVIIGLQVRNTPRKKAEAIAHELIENYGLKGFEHSYPSELSGGMRQRVAFMRTLAFSPDVILLDEPFSALDSQTRLVLQSDVLRIIRERQCSVVLVTHDVGEAITMADRIVVITSRPGRVKSIHPVNIAAEQRHPLKIRKLPEFTALYETIWSELGIDLAA